MLSRHCNIIEFMNTSSGLNRWLKGDLVGGKHLLKAGSDWWQAEVMPQLIGEKRESHSPPWRDGWITATRKSPQKNSRTSLVAISLHNTAPLSWICTFYAPLSDYHDSPKSWRVEKKEKREKDTGHDVIRIGQSLAFNGSLCLFPSPMSGVPVFILVTPANSADAVASMEQQTGRDRQTDKQNEGLSV